MNLRSHSRHQHAGALMKYKHIVNKPTLNNVWASRNEQRQQRTVSDQTDAFVDKG